MGNDGKLKEGATCGGVWWMRCAWEREKSVEVGDHIVVVGRVIEAGEYEGGRGMLAGVYVDKGYTRVRQSANHASDKNDQL